MSEDQHTVSFKFAPGFEAPWDVIRADSDDELRANLQSFLASDLPDLIAQVSVRLHAAYTLAKSGLVTSLAPQATVTPVAAPQAAPAAAWDQGPPQQAWAQPAAPAAPTNPPLQIVNDAPPGTPVCEHGPKVWKTAKPDSGKNWKAWFCPSPKGTVGQCPPAFQN